VQLRVDPASVEPGLGELPAGDDAVLEVEQVLAWAGKVAGHV